MFRHILAGALVLMLAVTLLISPRTWMLSDRHSEIAHVTDIPPQASGALVSQLAELIDDYGVHIPRGMTTAELVYQFFVATGRAPQASVVREVSRPRYGDSIREWSFLGMPFGWYEEHGFGVYTRDRQELVIAPLIPAGEAQLFRESGRDLKAGFVFPFWWHTWGWLYLAGVALWGWLHHRAIVKRREAEGII